MPINVLAISGSLRKGSYNTALLHAAAELSPPGVSFQFADFSTFPFYTDELKAHGFPPAVHEFREQIRASSAVVFATPEYNRSIPGGLKNAIDWASRGPEQPLIHKPVAVMTASPGGVGGALANYHLRQILSHLNCQVVSGEILIADAGNRFDANGKLINEKSREAVKAHMAKLIAAVASR